MIQEELKNKEKDIKGITRQACSLLDTAWAKGYVAGFNDGYKTGKEATKRPKGEWIPNDNLFHHGKTSYRCSVCNDVTDDVPTCLNKPLYKHCPVCGAEMEADDERKN